MNTAARLLEWLRPAPGERILDVGCGLGAQSALLARAGAIVTGIDPEAHLLEQARIACPEGRFFALSLSEFETDEPFDAVLAHAVLHWAGDPGAAFGKLASLLKPNGRLAASYGAKAVEASNLVNYYVPPANECRRVLAALGFQSIRIEEWSRGLLVYCERRRQD